MKGIPCSCVLGWGLVPSTWGGEAVPGAPRAGYKTSHDAASCQAAISLFLVARNHSSLRALLMTLLLITVILVVTHHETIKTFVCFFRATLS